MSDFDFKSYAIKKLNLVGFIALVGSSLFLLLSAYLFAGNETGAINWPLAICMMASRTMGIAAFLCGTALLLLEQWTTGPVIFILSLVLPVVFVFLFETI